MGKKNEYTQQLLAHTDWDAYLLQESGLPGPRGNLELAQAVADLGSVELFKRYIQYSDQDAPANSPYEFLVFCGVVGLGRLLAEGDFSYLTIMRNFASDPRWRIREAVAMALQRFGDANMPALLKEMQVWAMGNPLEQRAVAAALCEPCLLTKGEYALATLQLLDEIMTSLTNQEDRRSEDFRVLRKGLAYCWSVAAAALPDPGRNLIEKWSCCPDKDVQWIIKQNLRKARLLRMDADWVEKMRNKLSV